MKLEAISDGGEPLSIATIGGGGKALATEVQNRLSEAGLLEPPADGEFGPVWQWAMGEFSCRPSPAATIARCSDVPFSAAGVARNDDF